MSKSKIEEHKDEFIELYLKNGYSTRDLAKYFNVGQSTIRRKLKKWDVETRNYQESIKEERFKNKRKESAKALEKNIEVICPYCKNIFIKKPKENKKYCSNECANLSLKKDDFFIAKCSYCKEEYLSKRVNSKSNNNFCSSECQGKFMSENIVGKNSHSYNRVKVHCGYCNKELEVPQHRLKRKFVYCDKFCMAKHYKIRLRGVKNPHWTGGKRFYYGKNWLNNRDVVRKRDGYKCQRCGKKESENLEQLSVHHLKLFNTFKKSEDANNIENLISLCRDCHTFVHSNLNVNKEFLY